jgi:hypothetical protein
VLKRPTRARFFYSLDEVNRDKVRNEIASSNIADECSERLIERITDG